MAKTCKILLVEDHRDIQDLLRQLFADEGYRIVIVGDGAAMRRALDRDPAIDVVVIDLLLPGGIDGLTLADEAAARGLPTILVSGDHSQADSLKASGHPFLLKPFALTGFVALIDEVLCETKAKCERDGAARRYGRIEKVADDEAGGSMARAARPLPREAAP